MVVVAIFVAGFLSYPLIIENTPFSPAPEVSI